MFKYYCKHVILKWILFKKKINTNVKVWNATCLTCTDNCMLFNLIFTLYLRRTWLRCICIYICNTYYILNMHAVNLFKTSFEIFVLLYNFTGNIYNIRPLPFHVHIQNCLHVYCLYSSCWPALNIIVTPIYMIVNFVSVFPSYETKSRYLNTLIRHDSSFSIYIVWGLTETPIWINLSFHLTSFTIKILDSDFIGWSKSICICKWTF